jgi:hypothetical protein
MALKASALNPYARAPLCVAQVDPASGRHMRAYFFLGAVPRAVLEAARRSKLAPLGTLDWAPADRETLRGYYGAHWRELLTPSDPENPIRGAKGGAELDFGDLRAFNDLEETQNTKDDPDSFLESDSASMPRAAPTVRVAAPTYTDVAVYPEDTVYELRLKLYLASGVAPYRQHLFYYVNDEGPELPYRLTLDGAPVLPDWRDIAGREATPSQEVFAGFAVDSKLMQRHDTLYVEALDTFRLLGPTANTRITRAYFVDLYVALPPLNAPERPNDGLAGILRDSMQFDILYYGAVVRWWPQLSPDAFGLAMASPDRVGEAYPALDPDPDVLKTRFALERPLADRAAVWRPASSASAGRKSQVAVTSASVRVAPLAARMRVAIRNVFDLVPTSPAVAAIAARFEVDLGGLREEQKEEAISQIGVSWKGAPPGTLDASGTASFLLRSGHVLIAAVKRHASSFGPRAADYVDAFAARPPRRDDVAFALARDVGLSRAHAGGPDLEPIRYARLVIHADGSYEVAADWPEHDRVGLEAVFTETQRVAAPVLEAVNMMGAAAFPIGGRLESTDKAPRAYASLGAVTASASWPHALTAAAFRDMKAAFREYERAGIVGIRGLQQAGAYAFFFRRGVTAHDPRTADRAVRGTTRAVAGTVNQYAWLTDASVAARWATAFQGRTVRIHHRATDLRVEVLGADSLAEFELIQRYVFAFLDGFWQSRSAKERSREKEVEPTVMKVEHHSHRLKRLQERDPVLFDLKRYDPDATQYSVLCQSKRQPHVYNEAEARELGVQKRAKLIRYWNFTDGAPAFYGCPDPRYAHLSFRAGLHPLGFCLPCCKKARAPPGSRAALANLGCIRKHAWAPTAEEEAELGSSRHVFSYGKAIPEGRVAEVAREVTEGLFLDALPPPYRLQQVGVPQSVPAVPIAGYAFSLAHVLAEGEQTADDVLTALAGLAATMTDTYYVLGSGSGAAFASAQALADAILGAFVRREDALSPFGPGGVAAHIWPAILAELARHVYGVEVVVLADPLGDGAITLEAQPEAVAALADPRSAPLNVVLFASGPTGTFPVVAMNPKFYTRVPLSSRWMAGRRIYTDGPIDLSVSSGPEGPSGRYAPHQHASQLKDEEPIVDKVVKTVREVMAYAAREMSGGVRSHALDLALLLRYTRAKEVKPGKHSPQIEALLVDMHNCCYGVMLRDDTAAVYIPVRPSLYGALANGTKIIYGTRPEVPLPRKALEEAIADINEFIRREKGSPIVPNASLTNPEGACIGFLAAKPHSLYFFHDPELIPNSPEGAPISFPYDVREIDLAILAAKRQASKTSPHALDSVETLAAVTTNRNRLYRLFLAEFSEVLRAERNAPMRERIATALKATDFKSSESVKALRQSLAEVLAGHPGDLAAVRDAIKQAQPSDDAAREALAAINASSFEFDRQSLARLRALKSHDEVVLELKEMLGTHITTVNEKTVRPVENIYVSCSSANSNAVAAAATHSQCASVSGKRRLVVPADRLGDFYDCLAADIHNPGKSGLLAAVSAGVFEPLSFIRRPGEHLSLGLG